MGPGGNQKFPINWEFQSILQTLQTQEHTPCPKEGMTEAALARAEEEQEVRWSAAKANLFSEHWCIMYILLFPLCRILIGFPGKKKLCSTWISQACQAAENALYGWAEHTEHLWLGQAEIPSKCLTSQTEPWSPLRDTGAAWENLGKYSPPPRLSPFLFPYFEVL